MTGGGRMASPVRAFIVGPTGVGKTDVAMIAARELEAEIINVDSRQIYRGLEIGTAKPTIAQRRQVPHHLIDCLDPWERCSAGRFLSLLRDVMDGLAARGRIALAVGGAGLYVDACMGRFHELPPADEALRDRYEKIAATHGPEALHGMLRELDPATAARLSPRDQQRITRALEVAESTGHPLSERFQEPATAVCPPSTPVIFLSRERRDLYGRIEARCRAMVAAGLPAEVRRLIESGLTLTSPGMKSLGYAEWGRWALGESDQEEAMELFLRNSASLCQAPGNLVQESAPRANGDTNRRRRAVPGDGGSVARKPPAGVSRAFLRDPAGRRAHADRGTQPRACAQAP